MRKISNLLILIVLLCSIFYFNSSQEKYANIVSKTIPSTVEITNIVLIKNPITDEYQKAQILGSGVFISPKGYILTVAHLFKFKKIYSINIKLSNEDIVAGRIIRISDKDDLALIKVDFFKTTSFVQLADPRKIKIGQEIFAIGSPYDLSFTVTNGIISGLYRDIPATGGYNLLQSNVAINPGNSGGGMFNLKGELVGINSFIRYPFSCTSFSVFSGQCLEFLVRTSKNEPMLRRYDWLHTLLQYKEVIL